MGTRLQETLMGLGMRVSLHTDKKFLAFFFKRLKDNETTRYQKEFPYISPCGPETNYIRCDDVPIVFTHLLNTHKHIIQDIRDYATSATIEETYLSFGGAGELLTIHFQPEKLHMFPESGRVYHVGPEKSGSVGLIKSSLAIELSRYFVYNSDRSHDKGEESCDNIPPTGFTWRERTYELDNTIEKYLKQKRNVEISAN